MNFNSKANFNLRQNIILIVFIGLLAALLLRMSQLTLQEGEEYRNLADQRRLRKVFESGSRGEIRDRNGRLLAGNIPSFTVQIKKDELLSKKNEEKRNQNLLTLVRLLEEDGIIYQTDFPIDLNVYYYPEIEDYFNKISPMEYMLEQAQKDDILYEFINGNVNLENYENHFVYSMKNRVLSAITEKYIDNPILLKDNNFVADEDKLSNFLKEKELPQNLDAEKCVIYIVKNDTSIIRKLLNHPIARAILFEIVKNKNLIENVRMKPIECKYTQEYLEQKIKNIERFPGITMESSAEDDFLFVSTTEVLEKVLNSTYNDGSLIPGEKLIKLFRKNNQFKDLNIYTDSKQTHLFYKYDDSQKDNYDPVKDLINSLSPTMLKEFILDPELISIFQSELLNKNINLGISVSNGIRYQAERNEENFYSRFYKSDELKDNNKNLEDLFLLARKRFDIDENISKYEALGMLNIYELVNSVGDSAYKPVNLCYGIRDYMVAKLEERLDENIGISVGIEPIRYYPLGKNSSHVLGYIGKISTEKELDKYVKELGYDRNDFIGKTGIEESYEEKLKGISGEKLVEVDSQGNTVNIISEKKPQPGNSVYLTIDASLQQKAEEWLKKTIDATARKGVYKSIWGDYQMDGTLDTKRAYSNANAGAVVVMNPKTGEILAMASYPGYDPNLFSTGISLNDWNKLVPEDDENPLAARPLLNIATQTAVQPGSTFKMLTGYTALQKGLDPFEEIYDGGFVEIGQQKFRCLIYTLVGGSHGYVNLAKALEHSCNYYFFSLILGENQRQNHKKISAKVDIEDLVQAGKDFGLDQPTGIEINIPKEVVGGVPEPEQKIVATKFYIRKFLENHLKNYTKTEKSDDDLYYDIAVISNWAEEGRTLSKNELIRRLELMGYYADSKVKNESRTLADSLKFDYLNQAKWSIADTLQVSIGQGQSKFTPLQIANYVSAIVNGGYKNKATLIYSVKNAEHTVDIMNFEPVQTKLDIKNPTGYEQLKKGMQLVSDRGTSRRVFKDFPIKTGSKTGTAQIQGINPSTGKPYDDFGWFVSFAPYDDPEVVVSVLLFQGGTGSNGGPLARDLMAEYLGLNKQKIINNLQFENVLSQ